MKFFFFLLSNLLVIASWSVMNAEEFKAVTLSSLDAAVELEISQTYIKNGITIEGVGTFDQSCGLLTFFAIEDGKRNKLGHVLKKGWRFESIHERKPFEWRFYSLSKNRHLVIGFAKNEQELICEFVNIRDAEVNGKTFKLGRGDFFSIDRLSLDFVGVSEVTLEKNESGNFLLVETTTKKTAKYEIDFGDETLRLID